MIKKTTLKNLIYLLLTFTVIIPSVSSCAKKGMSTEQRKKQQSKNKKKNPGGCPQLDCY